VHAGYEVAAATRLPDPALTRQGIAVQPLGDLVEVANWSPLLAGVDSVVHLAGRAHVLRETAAGARQLYERNNVDLCKAVATGAMTAGVGQFIYMSSIKVFGDGPFAAPLKSNQPALPQDDYGRSKLSAEQWLQGAGRRGDLQAVIVRPPLVYGPGVRANFLRLVRLVRSGYPLPFAGLQNSRSLVSVWNLVDLIVRLIERRATASGIWHVSDGDDCSTTRLIEEIARAMHRRARLFAVPTRLLEASFSALGAGREYQRLFGSLRVDMADTTATLDWRPVLSLREGLDRTVSWYETSHDGDAT
jgi:UDP-glucose 4-epimerase